VDDAGLGAWMEKRGVSAAWVVSERGLQEVAAAWPSARRVPIGEGVLVLR
jgi:hypothetical protein